MNRAITSYPARRGYRPGVVFPPKVPGVRGAIDIHCHAHEGQQDALALAQLASESGMRGILYKTIGSISGEYRPMDSLKTVQDALARWSDSSGIEPIRCWAGYGITMDNKAPSLHKLRRNLDDGVAAVWLPVFNHANTYNKVGGRSIWMDPNADPKAHTKPLPWDEALKYGHYMLGDDGKLKPFYEETVRIVADHDAALFFGHATHPEIHALAELVDLSIEQMQALVRIGITLNFTYDEISPLLGVDPKRMYDAVRAAGVEHVTLSSDAGEPLFPHSVECMRLMRGYMEAFGLSREEADVACCVNPARILKYS